MMSIMWNKDKFNTNGNVFDVNTVIKRSNEQNTIFLEGELKCDNDDEDRSGIRCKDRATVGEKTGIINRPDLKQYELKIHRKWIVLLAAFFISALTGGFPMSMSVLFVEWLHDFQKSNSETAVHVVQSVCLGFFAVGVFGGIKNVFGGYCKAFGGLLYVESEAPFGETSSFCTMKIMYIYINMVFGFTNNVFGGYFEVFGGLLYVESEALRGNIVISHGMISGIMVTKYGPRRCTIASGMLAAVGVAVSYFATNILHLVLTISILTGCACSLGFASAFESVGLYFKGKHRLTVLGFLVFGSGCGISALTIVSQRLINEYGWRGSVLIEAGIMLNITVMGCLLQVPSNLNQNENRKRAKYNILKTCDQSKDLVQPKTNILIIKNTPSLQGQDQASHDFTTNKGNINNEVLHILRNIMKNHGFIFFCFIQAVCIAAFNSTFILLIDYYEQKGLTRSDGVTIYFYMTMVGNISRLLPGFVVRLPHVSTFFIPAFGTLIGGTSLALFPVTGKSFSLNFIVSCSYGITLSCIRAARPMAIQKLVGAQNYSIGLGISLTLTGVFNIAAGPISGFVRDKTDNNDTFVYSSAAALILSSVSFFILMCCRHNDKTDKFRMTEIKTTGQLRI